MFNFLIYKYNDKSDKRTHINKYFNSYIKESVLCIIFFFKKKGLRSLFHRTDSHFDFINFLM